MQRWDSWDTGHAGGGPPVALTLRFCFLWKELPCSFNLRESEEQDWYSGIPALCPPHFACCFDLHAAQERGLRSPPWNTPGLALAVTLAPLWKNISSVCLRAQLASEGLTESETCIFFTTRFPAGLNVKLGGCSLGTASCCDSLRTCC